MLTKVTPFVAALIICSGVALAQSSGGSSGSGAGSDNSGQNNDNVGGTGSGTGSGTGTTGSGSVGGSGSMNLDADGNGQLSIQEVRQGTQGDNADDVFGGLSQEQVRALQDECKNDQIADNKATCDRLSSMK